MHNATRTRLRLPALACLVLLAACSDTADTNGGASSQRARSVPVTAAPLAYEELVTRLEAVGTSQALKSVTLYPEAAGEVVDMHFLPGDHVERGDTLLELESRDQKLALELAEVRLEETRRLYDRYDRANRSVDLTVPETTVDTARTALETARIERDLAQVALERRFVNAPFSGHVGITDVEVGDRIDTTVAITTLDDRSALQVTFDAPESFVGQLAVNDPVTVTTWRGNDAPVEGQVVEVDSRINPVSRAFRARARVRNEGDLLRPGMSFRVALSLNRGRFPAVSEVAVQWGAEGPYVWVAEDSKARRVPVRLIERLKGRILVEGELARGDMIIGEGVQSMREGLALRVMDARAIARDVRDSSDSSSGS